MTDLGLSTTSSLDTVTEQLHDEGSMEPLPKKFKPTENVLAVRTDLEERLNSILCCTVCLDLPNVAMYQVG